jgi:hypothetical protein
MKKIKEKNIDAMTSMKEMSVAGTGGFTGSAAAAGPVAGFDPVLGKMQRRKKLKSFKQYANR